MSTLLSLIGFIAFLAVVAGLYFWTRRTERDTAFEQAPGLQTEEQANANRLGIALNANQGGIGGQ